MVRLENQSRFFGSVYKTLITSSVFHIILHRLNFMKHKKSIVK